MLIKNPFTLNDWNIKEFLMVILSIQMMVFGLLGLDFIGVHIPLLRQIIIFLYLIFVPGIVILRALKIHRIGSIETILYSLGLSLSCLMFLGFLINRFYPILGIHKPISLIPLTFTISLFVMVTCVLAYLRDKDYLESDNIFIKEYNFQTLLFLSLIPFLAILGSYLLNFYNINFVLMFLIILIALIPFLIAFDKIPKKLYPLAVFVIALSLLYQNSLISNYLTGYDVQIEYYFSNLVYLSGYWNSNIISDNVNSILSIPILVPTFAILCKINVTWILKAIYPFIFSFAPLGLYALFKKQTNAKIAFFSCFFLTSVFGFYTLMPQLARQEIGELFIVLVLMIILDRNITNIKNSFLLIVFSFSLIVSHYTLSYIFTLILILALFISFIFQKNVFRRVLIKNSSFQLISNQKIKFITLNFVILFLIFSLAWYLYTSSSSAFNAIVNIINNIFSNFAADFINPSSREVTTIITGETSWTREVTKYLFLISNASIVFGIFSALFLKIKNCNFKNSYLYFSLATFAIWIMGIVIPNFATWFTGRMYQVTLLILAPFFVVGMMGVLNVVCKLFKLQWKDKYVKIVYIGLSLFLAIFLLFNSGFVYEIVNDNPTSISFNSKIDSARFSEPEVLGAEWASSKTGGSVYGDNYGTLLIHEFRFNGVKTFNRYTTTIPSDSSIFFRNLNVNGKIVESGQYPVKINETKLLEVVNQKNKIFDDGKSFVYQ